MRAPLRVLAAGVLLVGIAALAPSAATGTPHRVHRRLAATVTVSMQNVAYSPQQVTIAVGDTVTWTNDDPFAHSVTADDGSFDSSPGCPGGACIDPGGTYSHTFTSAGTFTYHCRIHGSAMTGTVVVTGGQVTTTSSSGTTTSSPTATTGPTATTAPTDPMAGMDMPPAPARGPAPAAAPMATDATFTG